MKRELKLEEDSLYKKILGRGYQWVFNPVHDSSLCLLKKQEAYSNSLINEYEIAIDTLAKIFEGLNSWVLTGGLAIPAAINTFYRKHNAMHIGLPSKDLPALLEKASENNYYLFERKWMIK